MCQLMSFNCVLLLHIHDLDIMHDCIHYEESGRLKPPLTAYTL